MLFSGENKMKDVLVNVKMKNALDLTAPAISQKIKLSQLNSEGRSQTFILKPNYLKQLVSIEIPDGITTIGKQAFMDCENLEAVVISPSVKKIDYRAFAHCPLLLSFDTVNVENISSLAFFNCSSLRSVFISKSVKLIAADFLNTSFDNCYSLTSIAVDKDNLYFTSEDGILFNKDKTCLIKYPASKAGTCYIIKDNVTDICKYAFSESRFLETVIIPSSVTDISCYAFLNCTNLKSIKFSPGITSVSMGTFSNCISLKDVQLPSNYRIYRAFCFLSLQRSF